ncbi:MAG: beta-ketoacyl-[acyl-carrier-protein] synthase family protein [Candidatus Neomarinimicrobiota bacterium]
MKHRVAITGMGVVSPIGNSIGEFSDNLQAGVSGVGPITLFDAGSFPTRIAAQVKWTKPALRDRKITFALEAARQALDNAKVCGTPPQGQGGLSLGIGLELFSMRDMAEYHQSGSTLPADQNERLTYIQTPSDLCVHMISDKYKLRTPPVTHVSACAAGTDALGTAFRMIANGRRSWMLAGGTDSMINPLGVGGFCKLMALSTRNSHPQQASRPFDKQRDGFVLGEGAAMLVLEKFEDARARGAAIYAEILGYGNSFDAHGISEPHPEGRGTFQSMKRALDEAGISPEAVDCINAHGTATPKNDPIETLAIKQLFGDHADKMAICATKSMIGHLISAAGAVEAVAVIACLEAGRVHPTINLTEPDPACDLDYVPNTGREADLAVILSNSFGFGGQNASILLGRAGNA